MSSKRAGQASKLQHKNGKLRIIAGEWRGRKLPIFSLDGLRPSGDRTRETLFNWLQADIVKAHCADLFAGTGALGFEALSRGATHVEFVENHAKVAALLGENTSLLQAQAKVNSCTAEHFLATYSGPAFDLVFIDPPFAANLWQATFTAINKNHLLVSEALVYVEAPAESIPAIPENWSVEKSKKIGAVQAILARVHFP